MSNLAMDGNLAYKLQPEMIEEINPLAPDPLKYTSVSLSEVFSNNTRLEASAFNLEAKAAKYKVEHCRYGYVHLWGKDGLVKDAYYGNRAKRDYVSKNTSGAIGFIGSSEMLYINPKPYKFISPNIKKIDGFKAPIGSVLISRSGTIGNVTLVNKTLSKLLISEHAIRIIPTDFGGYIYAFLKTNTGKTLVKANTFGAVVDEIEPEHLKNIIIPNAPELIKRQIHNLIVESYDLRDQSNELMDEAERILYEELQLPPIEQLKPKYFDDSVDLRNYTTKLSRLGFRLDCSYHTPEIQIINNKISQNAKSIENVGDLSKKIILAGVFKRTYVNECNGVPFLGGREIMQLNPQVEKYLSRSVHKSRIDKELAVKENYILVSDRGTIGKVQIVPKHWEGWAVSQNILKVVPISNLIAGYLYCFLNSDYGQYLVKRETYGSVVDMIDDNCLYRVIVPLLKNELKQKEINDKVLQANELRYQAYLKEQEAITIMNGIINNIK